MRNIRAKHTNKILISTDMKTKKFNYIKVIQQFFGYCWEDVSEYEANSNGTAKERKLLLHDLKEYRLTGYPTRVIFRREKNTLINN